MLTEIEAHRNRVDSYRSSVQVPASVGQTNGARIVNPSGSNVLMILRALELYSSAADNYNLQFSSTTTTTISPDGVQNLNASLADDNKCTIGGVYDVAADTTNRFQRHLLSGAGSTQLNDVDNITLEPGRVLEVVGEVANLSAVFSVEWEERAF